MSAEVFFPCVEHSLKQYHIFRLFQFGQRDVFRVLVHYAQWAFYGHFVIAKLLVGENFALLRFFEVCEQLDDSLSVVFGSFTVLLAEVLAQRSADFCGINQLHQSLAPFFLSVGDNPDVRTYARVVEVLFGHGNDGFKQVVLNDILAQIACPAASIASEKRRAVMHLHDTSAKRCVVLHSADVIGKKHHLAVADVGQERNFFFVFVEYGKARICKLRFFRLF